MLALPSELRPLFSWHLSQPLLSSIECPHDPCVSVKDPTIVYYEEQWHLFCSIRSAVRSHQIENVSFDKWVNTNQTQRHILRCRDGYFCAP